MASSAQNAESWTGLTLGEVQALPVLRQQVPTIFFNEPSAARFWVSVPRKTGLCFFE